MGGSHGSDGLTAAEVPGVGEVAAAAERLAGRVRRTPVVEVGVPGVADPVALKLELLQHTGSFKPRGAFNRLLSCEVPPAGVVAASGGNHGLAVAYAARALGVPAAVFVPESASPVKVARVRSYGARVTVTGAWYADALAASTEHAAETGALVVHAYDQPEVVAGQATVGSELAEQAPGTDTVLVAVGGGGLIAGLRIAVPDRVRVVAVEPERAPTLHEALAAGGPVDVDVAGVAADSLGARRLGRLAYAVAAAAGMPSLLVTDDDILAARHWLWEELRLVAEPGGATALAALLGGRYRPEPGERVAVLVCGANTDPADLVPRD